MLGCLATIGWGVFFGLMVFGSLRAAGVLYTDESIEAVGLVNCKVGFEGFELSMDVDETYFSVNQLKKEDSSDEDEDD